MNINLHFHIEHVHVTVKDDDQLKQILEGINSLNSKLNIMSERDEKALQDLEAIKTTIDKVKAETTTTLQKLKELQDAATADSGTPQSVLDKIAEVAASVKIVDDLIPDAPTTDEEEQP